MKLLEQTLKAIRPTDKQWEARAQAHLDDLTKPLGSLGYLEEIAKKLITIYQDQITDLNKKVVFTFAGDHGITSEGVSAYPKDVTPQMVFNFLRGGAAINVLARHCGAEVVVVDVGVDYDFGDIEGLAKRKVVRGTKNFTLQPAMTMDETIRAVEVGIELGNEYCAKGYRLFGTGDMGIGNTTPSSAITAVITGSKVADVTGRGTGIDDTGLSRKVATIEKALRLHNPDPSKPLEVLSMVGGAEIAAIVGLILAVSANRQVVVIDGFISTASALIAYSLKPEVRDYMFAGHCSVEKGHIVALRHIGLRPILDLDMRLGEGTGAVLAMPIIESALKIYREMATFSSAGVSKKL